jgi:hypothetical protein
MLDVLNVGLPFYEIIICRYFPQDYQGRITITKKVGKSMIPLVLESGETATETEIRDLINCRGHHEFTLQHSLKILWENFRFVHTQIEF